MRKAHLAAGVVIALVMGLLLASRLMGPQLSSVQVVPRDLVRTVVATGRVEAPHRVELGAQMVASVASVPVIEGQAVQAGEVLIRLEADELSAAVREADLAVAQAQARLRQLQEVQRPVSGQALRQAAATLENARAQLQRQEDLFRRGYIGQATLDEARKALALADAQLAAAQRQHDTTLAGGSDEAIATTALAQARAGAEAARARFQHATVTAPAAGTIIKRDVEPGDVVQPGKTLLVLSPSGETQLIVQFDEKNLGLLVVGQPALASADAFPDQRFAAEVVAISPGVDVQRGSVEVKLRVPQPPAYLRQNMTVSVDVEVARRPQALAVPLELVHEAEGGSPWVWVIEGGRTRQQAVQLGLRGAGQVEVTQGLRAGDEVTAGPSREGARVRASGASS
ncbi:MAG: efflux RND transporter periplasmic adaptor subunit [Methylotenera sp.]|jgi:HlyD family secretion protein|nr:efflux RND transporter periplasmic adaptor subunit [Methylotenera sp.]